MTTVFEQMGGEDGIRRLVGRFYELMDTLPEAATIRAMHAPDLTESSEKLTLFLIGWSGGPPAYVEKHGHPRLRARHMPFAVDDDAAAAWMRCMGLALEDEARSGAMEPAVAQGLFDAFLRIAGHMRNR
ncbi:MAG: group II truncated hemoglobin [Myxococcota bacterium]|nr:group II truncated hemoglobin [Myxococcota bacterium]